MGLLLITYFINSKVSAPARVKKLINTRRGTTPTEEQGRCKGLTRSMGASLD